MDKGPDIVREFEPMPEKKTDRRTNRTRRQLSSALVDLVKEKRFDEISVQNVIDRADVGRSTFYSHFRDKDDLFQKDWERFLDGFAQHIDWEKARTGSFVPVVYLFGHLRDSQPFYQSLVRSQKADSIFRSGMNHLSQRIESALASRLKGKPAPSIPIPVLANYLASELFSLLKWWLDHKMPYSPERMDEIFHELVSPTFRALLKSN
jgi:AcrR family transcriptional regulator